MTEVHNFAHRIAANVTKENLADIVQAQRLFEQLTCIRFVPWINTSTNEMLGVRQGHLHFVHGDHCFAFEGKHEQTEGQGISCCSGDTCIHELGHALGLQVSSQ